MMKEKQNKIDRRNFLKTMGAAGVAPAFAGVANVLGSATSKGVTAEPNAPAKAQQSEFPQVPRRKLGKTGADIPILSFGAMFNIVENQVILHNTLKWGVNYWDTASSYAGGNSEIGIGNFLAKNPDVRKKIFLVTKASNARKEPTPQAIVKKVKELLHKSLKRMNTEHIDLYYGIHGLRDPVQLDDELRKWAESAKKRKLIRFFGFTTHTNMAECLQAAARLDWIDAIMVKYNFRLMQEPKMAAAVEACHKKGIGLIAMKTQAFRRREEIDSEVDEKLISHFQKQGFTQGQAKIKAVLDDGKIASACVGMKTIALVTENVGAVLDKTKLSQADKDALAEYARNTCSGFCAGCANICESALPDMPYISDIMRYLMYYNSYGDKQRAKKLFAQIPTDVRSRLLKADYSAAEAACPQRIPIAKAVAEAVSKLA